MTGRPVQGQRLSGVRELWIESPGSAGSSVWVGRLFEGGKPWDSAGLLGRSDIHLGHEIPLPWGPEASEEQVAEFARKQFPGWTIGIVAPYHAPVAPGEACPRCRGLGLYR